MLLWRQVGTVHAEDCMDDGSPICLSVTIDRRDGSAIFDFEGVLFPLQCGLLRRMCLTTSQGVRNPSNGANSPPEVLKKLCAALSDGLMK